MGIFDKQTPEPFVASYKSSGKKITCAACGNDKFEVRDVLLNTTLMTFFGLDWANKTAAAMICTNCTKIEWYLNRPEVLEN
jgi:predicted nucleic-acid-binding Zn-ribbon protein